MRYYKVSEKGGTGSFLCPPGHPRHQYSLDEYSGPRGRVVQGTHVIDYALTGEADASRQILTQIRKIMGESVMVPSELWIRNVYGYFHSMWLPESGSRTASDLVSRRPDGAGLDRHAAVACIREYFPDHEPRADLIDNRGKGYGSYPCDKCGERVQYEAKFDKLANFTTRTTVSGTECPKGGDHVVA